MTLYDIRYAPPCIVIVGHDAPFGEKATTGVLFSCVLVTCDRPGSGHGASVLYLIKYNLLTGHQQSLRSFLHDTLKQQYQANKASTATPHYKMEDSVIQTSGM